MLRVIAMFQIGQKVQEDTKTTRLSASTNGDHVEKMPALICKHRRQIVCEVVEEGISEILCYAVLT